MIADVENIQTLRADSVLTIVQAFSSCNFIPQTADNDTTMWSERILPALLNNRNLTERNPSQSSWLLFTLQLAILGHYDQELISRVFSSAYLDSYLTRDKLSILDYSKILILYQTVAMQPNIDLDQVDLKKKMSNLCQRYVDEMPSCDIQLDLIDHIGQSFVLTNVRTKYMHLLPILVKINKQTGHFERFANEFGRDKDGFIPLERIHCEPNEVL